VLDPSLAVIALAVALAFVGIGGGLYEFLVVDPAWPERPEIVQPDRGGVSRRRFWIPAHTAFELMLIAALVVAWSRPSVRAWLLTGLASHAAMRIWSAFDFIPKALAFERADPATITADQARRWTRRSLWRLPLDVVTGVAMLAAFATALAA
jgi:hypothetical protein